MFDNDKYSEFFSPDRQTGCPFNIMFAKLLRFILFNKMGTQLLE